MTLPTLCKYANIFGAPQTGPHSIRFLNLAVVDVVCTIIGAYILAFFMKVPFLYVLLAVFFLGIVLHRLFCVNTTIDKWLKKYIV